MSEDARGNKGRARVFRVTNPSPERDSDDSDDKQTQNLTSHLAHHTHQSLRPNRPPQKPQPSYHNQPTPLTTHLPHHPSSHPSLSSPSTSDSPAAEESTPPPSTPALTVPPVDFTADTPTLHEPTIAAHSIDRQVVDNSQGTTSRKERFIRAIGAPFHGRRERPPADNPPRRPRTSPTVSTPDSINSVSSTSTISGKVLIVVTTDSDWYVTVDISGAPHAAFVRECIFNKLNIQDDDQLRFSIYQTEMGAYAIGDALTDEKLFNLCRDLGDSKGSLKFFVSHTSAPVHEQPLRPHSPPVTTIPPPVLPYNTNITSTPLRPKRRSRQESISSQSEQYPLETAGGYEADLDNPDRETLQRTQPHPLPSFPQPPESSVPFTNTTNPPSSPRHTRRPNGQAPRPSSPHLRPPRPTTPPPPPPPPPLPLPDNPRSEFSTYDPRHFVTLPPPQPLSPNRSNPLSEENLTLSLAQRHGRTSSDAATEREQIPKANDQYDLAGKQPRPRQPQAIGGRLRAEPSKESLSPHKDRRKRYPNEIEEPVGRSDSWVVVPRAGESELSPPAQELPLASGQPTRSGPRQQPQPPQRSRITSPFTGRPVAMPNAPRQPPPVPLGPDMRPTPPRPAGVPISNKFFIAWKGESRGDQRAMPPSASQWNRLTKGTKSMDNLRAAAYNNPTTLQPGTNRRFGPLPMSRQPPVPPYPGFPPGVPKSYETPRIRPLPVQGSTYSSNLDLGRDAYSARVPYLGSLISPNQDPYPRPQSAFGDSMPSPTQRHQRLQSPTLGSMESGEPGRSPRGISPNRSYHSTHFSGSKLESSYGSRSDRSSDVQSGAETSYTTPPRTPISPRSPLYPGRDNKSSSSSRPSTSDSKVNGSHEAHRTLRPEDQTWLSTIISQSSDGTLVPSREATNKPRSETPPPPSATSVVSDSTYLNQFEPGSDGDDMGTSIWKKRPTAEAEQPKSILRPPLKVQIEPSLSSSNEETPPTIKPTQSAHHVLVPPSIPPPPPSKPSQSQRRVPGNRERGPRGSTFTDRQSSTWAPRPPPEDVYERLEEFFPEHDLDKPVIEANSGGTSPTAAEPAIPVPPVPVLPEKTRIRGKKSIRIVAEEHKKLIDRTSRADAASYSNVIRKRSTKLWGIKLEEVTTALPKFQSSQAAPDSPSAGTTFKWVRGELIGRGTYGRVYLALNATTGEMIAVKQVELPRTASDKNDSRQVTVVQALKMESETLKDLDHPNIVQYLGFEETPANLSIFLEYVPGGSIGSCLLKHGKFEENVTKSFTGQILAGLEYLHSKGILHRDLKADNILVEMSGVCKISDFGISKRTDDSGGAFTAMKGTVFWMAPEVINTQKKGYNFKIDIWSVGCVVLEMWAGMRPWMGDEVVAVMFKLYQSKLPPPVPEDVVLSELADDFRRKCFAINPEERPTAAELRRHEYLVLPPDWVFTDFSE